MNNNYEIHPEVIEAVNYKILILTLPVGDIEDILTKFVSERGRISRSLYEDFLIGTCVANINQYMTHINVISAANDIDLVKLREDTVELVVKHNPKLLPECIFINKNNVLKLKQGDDVFDGVTLVDNPYWNKPFEEPVHEVYDKKMPTNGTPKEIKDMEWEKIRTWWDRISEHIYIKKFSSEDVESILKDGYFRNRTGFNTFIVSNCIVDVDDVYAQIEGMGANVDPNKIVRELFSMCEEVNPEMTYNRARELQGVDDESPELSEGRERGTSQGVAKVGGELKHSKKKHKKTFKNVTKEELLKLEENIKVSLVGQDDAVKSLCESIKRASVGLKDPIKPIGSFMFAGRSGCGKSLSAKVLADELIREKRNKIIIDCSEYTGDHEYSKLIGSPNGYTGFEQGGVLTNAIEETPFAVVIFDEVEKASRKVHELMLQIMDEGRLTDGKGKTVLFKDAIIVMTSNIGVNEIDSITKTIGFGDVAKITESKKNIALNVALKKKFKPEFLNRLDSIICFRDLNKQDYMRIIDIELYKLMDNLKSNDTDYKDIQLSFDKKIKNFIYKHGVDPKFGARPIKRAIEKYISTEIANKVLENTLPSDTILNVSVVSGKINVSEKEQLIKDKTLLSKDNTLGVK